MRFAIALAVLLAACSNGGADELPSGPQYVVPPAPGSTLVPAKPVTMPPSQPRRMPDRPGCLTASFSPSELDEFACGLRATLGHPDADSGFREEVGFQNAFWQGLPRPIDHYYYDDCDAPTGNAKSFSQRFIIFGINMFWSSMEVYQNWGPIAGILGHEWAHQAQYAFNWMDSASKVIELEADALAGYYMHFGSGLDRLAIELFFNKLHMLGGYFTNHPDHHGTPEERMHMGMFGAELARIALANGIAYNYQQLHTFIRAEIAALGPTGLLPATVPPGFDEVKAWIALHGHEDFGPPTMPYEERTRLFPRP
jgi:hypothetical protein